MVQWDRRFREHAVFDTIRQLQAAVATAKQTVDEHEVRDSTAIDGIARLESILSWVEKSLGNTEPLLASEGTLNNIHSPFQAALRQVNEFNANRNSGHVANANNNADSAVVACSQLPRINGIEDLASVSDTVVSFRRSVAQHHSIVEREATALKERIEELQRTASSTKDDVNRQTTRLENALGQFQEQFSDAQEARRQEVDELLEDLKEKFSTREKEREGAHEARMEELIQQQKESVGQTESLREKAERLVQAVGSAGMTTGYQGVANRMARHAFWWQVGSVVSVLTFVIFGAWYVLPHVSGDSAWTLVLIRVFMSLPLLLLAGFCISQVRHFHRLEEQNRSMELQLASLDPFVANLPEDFQRSIKQEAVQRFFPGHKEGEAKP